MERAGRGYFVRDILLTAAVAAAGVLLPFVRDAQAGHTTSAPTSKHFKQTHAPTRPAPEMTRFTASTASNPYLDQALKDAGTDIFMMDPDHKDLEILNLMSKESTLASFAKKRTASNQKMFLVIERPEGLQNLVDQLEQGHLSVEAFAQAMHENMLLNFQSGDEAIRQHTLTGLMIVNAKKLGFHTLCADSYDLKKVQDPVLRKYLDHLDHEAEARGFNKLPRGEGARAKREMENAYFETLPESEQVAIRRAFILTRLAHDHVIRQRIDQVVGADNLVVSFYGANHTNLRGGNAYKVGLNHYNTPSDFEGASLLVDVAEVLKAHYLQTAQETPRQDESASKLGAKRDRAAEHRALGERFLKRSQTQKTL